MPEPTEIEAKFVLSPAVRDSLMSVERLGRFAVTNRYAIEQTDLYYDTRYSTLRRHGATLRIRRTPAGALMTFKGKRDTSHDQDHAHIASRPEYEAPVSAEFLAGVAEAHPLPQDPALLPLSRARFLVGERELISTACIHNRRFVINLADADDNALELALDDCSGIRLADRRTVTFLEAELESKRGDPALLVAVTAELCQIAPDLQPSRATKLGRVMD
jgi:inorganic triphosphatase YgiF